MNKYKGYCNTWFITLLLLLAVFIPGCSGSGGMGGSPGTGGSIADTTASSIVDTAAPTVTATNPVNSETGVATNMAIAATFSKDMEPSTITMEVFTMTGPGIVPVTGTVRYTGLTATFTPSTNFAINTVYTATISTAAKDLMGNAMAANYTWTFTTGASADVTAPTVTLASPANGAASVGINRRVAATFSKAMNPSTISTSTFTMTGPGVTPVTGTVSYVGLVATFTPSSNLAKSALYTATITTIAKDLAGNAMAANYTWTFTTGTSSDTTAPTITLVNPLNGAVGVGINKTVNATFNEDMDPTTITNLTFTVAGASGTVTYDTISNIASFNPTSNFATNTTYTATIITAVTDLAGNAIAANYTWNFTTGTDTVTEPVALGAIAPFGSFGGGAGMTSQGIFTVINGDIGTTGASTTITGFHDKNGYVYTETPLNVGYVNGTIYTATAPPGSIPGAAAAAAALDARTAYNNLTPASLPGGIALGTSALGGLTLAPGIYKSESGSYNIIGVDLTLDAQGDPNAVWVFQMATSLTVGGPGAAFPQSVLLINGAQAKNVFWQVGSAATINAAGGGTMAGTIIAEAGCTFSTAGNVTIATLNGRAIGLNASVTVVNTVINIPVP